MKNRETKSKVVTLANRLAKAMPRKDAFIQAWAIVRNGGIELSVKGVSFGSRQEALRRLAAYAPDRIKAVLVPEENNPADKNAIAVLVGVNNGKGLFRLGYVPANLTAVVSVLGAKPLALRVVSGTWGHAHKTTFGARVALSV